MENFIDALFIPISNISTFNKNELPKAESKYDTLLQQVRNESNIIATHLSEMYYKINTKGISSAEILQIITKTMKLIEEKEEGIKSLLNKINTENYFIFEERYLKILNWIKLLEVIQTNILVNADLENSEVEKIYTKLIDIIDIYQKIAEEILDNINSLNKNKDSISMKKIHSDYSKIEKGIILSERTKQELIKSLVAIDNVDVNLIQLLNDQETIVIFGEKKLVENSHDEFIETIKISASAVSKYSGHLVLKLKVKYPQLKLISDYLKPIKSFTVDYNNDWYAGTQSGQIYFGKAGFQGKEIANFGTTNNGVTTIVLDNNNNWYAGTQSGKLYFGKAGLQGKEIANLESNILSIGFYYNNDWYAITEDNLVHFGSSQNDVKNSLNFDDWVKTDVFSQNTYSYGVENNKLYFIQAAKPKEEIIELDSEITIFNMDYNSNWYAGTQSGKLYFAKNGQLGQKIADFKASITSFALEQYWYAGTQSGKIYSGNEDEEFKEIANLKSKVAITLLVCDNNNNWYIATDKGQLYFGQIEQLSKL